MFRLCRNIIFPKLKVINNSSKSTNIVNMYCSNINNIKENYLVIYNQEDIENIIDDVLNIDVIYLYDNINNYDYELGYKLQYFLLNKPNSKIYVNYKYYDNFIKFIENSTKYKTGVSYNNEKQIISSFWLN